MAAFHSDSSIADEVLQALATAVPGRRISVAVHDGRVTLRGVVAEAATRGTIKDLVADIDGVEAITDLITVNASDAPTAAPTAPVPRPRPGSRPQTDT